jgi:hypothetical protein
MVELPTRRAPALVIVLGALWMIAAALGLLFAFGLLVTFGFIARLGPPGGEPFPAAPPAARPIAWVFQHFLLVGSVQGGLAAAGLYAGVQFLRLKPWARGALEASGWAGIALALAWGTWLSGIAWDTSRPPFQVLSGLSIAIFWAAAPLVFVVLLRTRHVTSAFSPTRIQ